MATQGGEVSIKISTDTDDIKKLKAEMDALKAKTEESSKSFKGMASEVFKGVASWDLLKEALKKSVEFMKESIKAFNESERAQTRLRQVISGNADQYIRYANEMQNTLNIEEEQVLATITLAKNMGVTENKLKDVTKTAIGLSKAFGIDLDTATKLAINAGQGNIDMLARYIPTLRSATTEAEKQAIIQQAVANGFKIAEAEMGTFEGMMTTLKIQQGEIQEGFGAIAAEIGKKMLPSFVNMTRSFGDFLNNERLQKEIAKDIDIAFRSLTSAFTDFNGEVKPETFNSLVAIFKGFLTVIMSVDVVITGIANQLALLVLQFNALGRAIPEVGTLLNPFKSDQAKKDAKEYLRVIKSDLDIQTRMLDDVMKAKLDSIAKLWKGADEESNKGSAGLVGDSTAMGRARGMMGSAGPADEIVASAPSNKLKKAMEKLLSDNAKVAMSIVSQAAQSTTEIFNSISQAAQGFIQNQIALLDQQHTIELDMIQSRLDKELELIEYNGKTKEEYLKSELATKRAAGDEEKAKEIEKQLNIINVTKKANDERAAADKRYAMKKYELEVAAFNTAKAIQIITATGSLAMGIVNAWTAAASAASVSLVAAPAVFAAIGGTLTGILATMGAINIGLIASQQPPPPPKFATGGIVGGARGAGDQTTAMLSGGEMVLNEKQQKNLFSMANSGAGGMNAIFVLDGESVPIKNVMLKNKKNEAYRQ